MRQLVLFIQALGFRTTFASNEFFSGRLGRSVRQIGRYVHEAKRLCLIQCTVYKYVKYGRYLSRRFIQVLKNGKPTWGYPAHPELQGPVSSVIGLERDAEDGRWVKVEKPPSRPPPDVGLRPDLVALFASLEEEARIEAEREADPVWRAEEARRAEAARREYRRRVLNPNGTFKPFSHSPLVQRMLDNPQE